MKKKITINDEEFFYALVIENINDIYIDNIVESTIFYKEVETSTRKQYIFFGEAIITEYPIELFNVNYDIEDHNYTKEETKQAINQAYMDYKEDLDREEVLKTRKSEIEKGEII